MGIKIPRSNQVINPKRLSNLFSACLQLGYIGLSLFVVGREACCSLAIGRKLSHLPAEPSARCRGRPSDDGYVTRATGQTSNARRSWPRQGRYQRCQGPIWPTCALKECTRSSITLRPTRQRAGRWYGLKTSRWSLDAAIPCHHGQDMREGSGFGNSNRPKYRTFWDVIYEWMCGSAHLTTSILLAISILGCLSQPRAFTTLRTTKGLPCGRLNRIHSLWCLVMMLPLVAASEDEQIRHALRTRQQADALQPDLTYNSRWQWVRQHAGFLQPGRDRDYSATIHRPDSLPMPSPTGVRMQFQYPRDPMHYIVDIERFWNDLGPIYGQGLTWSVRLMPQVQPPNSLLTPDRWYYMLTTFAEDGLRPTEVPIYFEVEWVTPQTRHRGYAKPWTPRQITVVRFLQLHGLLAQCTTTHRCEMTIDGRAQRSTTITLRKASYIHILAKPMIPPTDSEDETHEPFAIMRSLRERTSSTDSTSSEITDDDDCGEEHSEGGESVGQPIYVTAIFRPAHGSGGPPFMHSTHGASSRRWIDDIYTTWPRLRYVAWSHYDVHEAYNRDFPQFDMVQHKVLVTLQDLTSALHQVAFVVGSMMDITVLQAWPYPPRTSASIVLYELGLWEMCGSRPDECKVSVNGLVLGLNEFRTLRHGDYILIRIAPTRGTEGRHRLRQAFGIPEDFEGLEYTTETGIARISGDGRRAQYGTPSLYHVPQSRTHTMLHEDYWLCMGAFAWIATLLLLRLQIRPEPHLPCGALKIKGIRHGFNAKRAKVRIPWVMLWLVVSQPLIPAAQGLQLPSCEGYGRSYTSGTATFHYDHGIATEWRPVGHHEKLPPPGNPNGLVVEEDWDDHCNIPPDFLEASLTTYGHWLRRQLPMIYEAQDLRAKLAAIKASIDCKVYGDTEFAPTSSDHAVRSTLPGKTEVSMPVT